MEVFMKLFKYMVRVTLAFGLLVSNTAVAMHDGMRNEDPLQGIDYQRAFNQTAIYHKFGELITEWGCDDNVFVKDDYKAASPSGCCSIPIARSWSMARAGGSTPGSSSTPSSVLARGLPGLPPRSAGWCSCRGSLRPVRRFCGGNW